AIFAGGTGKLTLSGMKIFGNYSTEGGGIYVGNSQGLILLDSEVSQNRAQVQSGYGGGGGIFLYSGITSQIIRSVVSGNQSTRDGGGIYTDYQASITITDSAIVWNSAANSGGGLYF